MNEYAEHSNKDCWCGGHNHKNSKKKKSHNSTSRKLSVKKNRKFKKRIDAAWEAVDADPYAQPNSPTGEIE